MSSQGSAAKVVNKTTTSEDTKVAPQRTAKVVPAGEASKKRPQKKKLAFFDTRTKHYSVEDEEIEVIVPKVSLSFKFFLFLFGATGIAFGIGVVYYGGISQLSDFYVVGIGAIVISIILLIVLLLLILRQRYYQKLANFQRRKVETLERKMIEAGIGEKRNDRYFIPPTDTAPDAIATRRKPSNAELYDNVSRVFNNRVASATSSTGQKSDGPLTVTGLTIRERTNDSRAGDFDNEDAKLPAVTPPPGVMFPKHKIQEEDVNHAVESDREGKDGVFTMPISIGEASKENKTNSVEDLKKSDVSLSGRLKSSHTSLRSNKEHYVNHAFESDKEGTDGVFTVPLGASVCVSLGDASPENKTNSADNLKRSNVSISGRLKSSHTSIQSDKDSDA